MSINLVVHTHAHTHRAVPILSMFCWTLNKAQRAEQADLLFTYYLCLHEKWAHALPFDSCKCISSCVLSNYRRSCSPFAFFIILVNYHCLWVLIVPHRNLAAAHAPLFSYYEEQILVLTMSRCLHLPRDVLYCTKGCYIVRGDMMNARFANAFLSRRGNSLMSK